MKSPELRSKFLEYFKGKDHKIVPSSSLVPEDKTVLLTSAGMQQFIPYLSGEKNVVEEFGDRHLASVQKCFRTPDIEEVGDDTHHTFFEMMGNWSIGEDKQGYFKEGAIDLALDFLVGELGLEKERLWVTVFKGENNIPKDEDSAKIWQQKGFPKERIKEFGLEDNFWGPVAEIGPCGPCSEIHYDRGPEFGCEDCGPNCEKCNRYVELWNLVFMEYNRREDGSFEKMSQRNVDTGIGFERLTALLQGKGSAYETDLFSSLINKIEDISGKKYEENKRDFRIIADHARGAFFLASDGVVPGNMEEGYILRRVLRRAIQQGRVLNMKEGFLNDLVEETVFKYGEAYSELKENKEKVLKVIKEEEEKFRQTLEAGIRVTAAIIDESGELTGELAFRQYESKGVPLEVSKKIASEKGARISDDLEKDFKKRLKEHQEISRAGAEKKFGGVGKGAGYEETKLHTTTHLLHQALREVLGEEVKQMGSDINSERLRFDFSYPRKMTEEEKERVEQVVNQKIQEGLEVKKEQMSLKEALNTGALAFFREKYPGKVNIYSVGDYSKEICAGPHVKNTSELGSFNIVNEKSSGAGVRRIKAILE